MFKKTRLISSGALDNSKGGVYNPSVVNFGAEIHCIVRVEDIPEDKRTNWKSTSATPVILILNNDLTIAYNETFKLINYPNEPYRIEDFRLFSYRNNLYVAHPIVIGDKVKQAVSRIGWTMEYGRTLTLVHTFESPFNHAWEKNWGFFVRDNQLYILYSVSPWIIYKVNSDWSLELVVRDNYDGSWVSENMLSISTLPIEYENNFLVIFHSRENKTYIQGALVFDYKTMLPIYYTKEPFLKGGNEKGLRPDVLYVSGILEQSSTIHLFYGEGDTHSSIYSIEKEEFNKLIYKNKIDNEKY